MAFYEKTKGHMGQYEDWWNLSEKDGVKLVIHHWSHTKVNGLQTNSGTEEYSVEKFLSGDHDSGAQSALRKILDL